MTRKPSKRGREKESDYGIVFEDVVGIVQAARRSAVRTLNSAMTAAYWLIGRRIVESEQAGSARADYGTRLLKRLAEGLTGRFGRGFSERNLEQMRRFYLEWPISQTLSAESGPRGNSVEDQAILQTSSGESQTVSAESVLRSAAMCFPLAWSTYVRLLGVSNRRAREFYETEALRGGWSVRQLGRQINSQFYERTALSRNKAAMLRKGQQALRDDAVSPEEAMKDPYVLEFLDLKDEYSESDLEEALVRHLETFLLELGGDFCFIGRQKRLRIGNVWYRIDLLFFHRVLRCMVVIDLKIGELTHADAGQMHMYLNYARKHWMREGENPPVGLILCAQKDEAVARYALEGLPNKVMAAEYRTVLPDEMILVAEIERTREILEERKLAALPSLRKGSTKSKGTTRLSEPAARQGSQGSSQKILDLIRQTPPITIKQLSAALGISDHAVKRHLRNLKQQGRLKRIGPDRGGHWEVVK